ncbi:MAG: MoaD/ThiS family protein [Dehalococcoidia bacterium]|nr:MoaD/ThiS family protein [Dehalococcoidia bacterium]
MTAKIEVNLFASLSRYKPGTIGGCSWMVDCLSGTTVRQLLDQLGVPIDEVRLVFKNGVHIPPDTVLEDGDRLGIFPPIGGG